MSFDIAIIKSDIKEVSSVAVINGKKLLMGKRTDNGRWTLPGGHLDSGEDETDGAARELFEEAGIEVKPKELTHLETKNITSHTGKKMAIHAYKYEWEGERPTSKNDPDKEVKKWEWIDYADGLPEEIKNNLHSPKNVVLMALGLMKSKSNEDSMKVEDTAEFTEAEAEKGGAGSGISGHRTMAMNGKDSVFHQDDKQKLEAKTFEEKIKQREEEEFKRMRIAATKKSGFSLVIDLLKSGPHKYLRKYMQGGKWQYVYYEGQNRPKRLEDEHHKILKRLAELGDQDAKALLDSTEAHPQDKIDELRQKAKDGITSAILKLKNEYGIDHEGEKLESKLIPAVARAPQDSTEKDMTPEQKAHFKEAVAQHVDAMLTNLRNHSSSPLATKVTEHGITKESLMEGVEGATSLKAAFAKLHSNLGKLDTAHEGLQSGNSMTSDHERSYANAIYNNSVKHMESKGHLPTGYSAEHKRTVANRGGEFALPKAGEMEKRARERAEREREENEREEREIGSTVGFYMASMIDGFDEPGRRADKVKKAKEINKAVKAIFGRPLTKEEFPYNFEEHGLKTKIKNVSVSGEEINLSMDILDADGNGIMDEWKRRWSKKDGRPHIYNAYMAVSTSARGGVQVGNLINAGQRKLMRSIEGGGVVGVTANIDVGGYNWANQGFSFGSENELNYYKRDFKDFMRGEGLTLIDEEMNSITEPCHMAMFTDGKKYEMRTSRGAALKLSAQQIATKSLSGVEGEHTLTRDEIASGKSSRMLVNLGKKFMLGRNWHGVWDSAKDTQASRFADSYYQMRESAVSILNEEYKGTLASVKTRAASRPAPAARTEAAAPSRSAPASTPGTDRSQMAIRHWTPPRSATGRGRIRMTAQRRATVMAMSDSDYRHFILNAPLTRESRAALNTARRNRPTDVPF